MTTLAERMRKLPKARGKKVEERAKELVAEEMSLQDLPVPVQRGEGVPSWLVGLLCGVHVALWQFRLGKGG